MRKIMHGLCTAKTSHGFCTGVALAPRLLRLVSLLLFACACALASPCLCLWLSWRIARRCAVAFHCGALAVHGAASFHSPPLACSSCFARLLQGPLEQKICARLCTDYARRRLCIVFVAPVPQLVRLLSFFLFACACDLASRCFCLWLSWRICRRRAVAFLTVFVLFVVKHSCGLAHQR